MKEAANWGGLQSERMPDAAQHHKQRTAVPPVVNLLVGNYKKYDCDGR